MYFEGRSCFFPEMREKKVCWFVGRPEVIFFSQGIRERGVFVLLVLVHTISRPARRRYCVSSMTDA